MKKNVKTFTIFVFFLVFLSALQPVWSANPFKGMPEVYGQFKDYTAKKGEDLYPIARKHGLAIEHVMFANGMSGIKTKPGQKLIIPFRRIPPPDKYKDGIVLNLPERGLYLYRDGKIKKFFPIAIGAPGRWMTPTGDMKIVTKVKNPTWLPPEWAKQEKPVPAGPNNPLGDRWMGLDRPGYGLHATNSPISIGRAASHGCMRMYPESAHELFENVFVNMPVKIIYEPVKVGYDPDEKAVYLSVYSDVYKKTPGLLEVAKEKLAEYNILGMIDEDRLEKIVKRKRGVPEKILGTDFVIKVNDKKMDFFFSPISKGGRIWVPSTVLKPMGAVLMWNNENKVVDIYRKDKNISLKVQKASNKIINSPKKGQPVSYLWQGRTIIPLSYVLKGLGVNYYWIPEYRTVLIYTGTRAGKKPDDKIEAAPDASPAPVDAPTPVVVPDDIPMETPSPSPSPSSIPEEAPEPHPESSPTPGN